LADCSSAVEDLTEEQTSEALAAMAFEQVAAAVMWESELGRLPEGKTRGTDLKEPEEKLEPETLGVHPSQRPDPSLGWELTSKLG